MTKFKSIKEISNIFIQVFDCGNQKLNDYLLYYAKQNDKKGIGKTLVYFDQNKIKGYVTLSSAQIEIEELTIENKKHLPKYPIPVIRIARLAVDKKCQSQNIGTSLLKEALKRILSASSFIGVYGIIVDSKDEAVKFYEKFGFKKLLTDKTIYFLPISTLIKSIKRK